MAQSTTGEQKAIDMEKFNISRVEHELKQRFWKFKKRQKRSNRSKNRVPIRTPHAFLRIAAYKKANGLAHSEYDLICSLVDQRGHTPSEKFEYNVFMWILLGIVGSDGPIDKITRNLIRQMAIELEYAQEHNVPTEYLIGFIHQIGGGRYIEKVRRCKH